jgi:hypothetical protein
MIDPNVVGVDAKAIHAESDGFTTDNAVSPDVLQLSGLQAGAEAHTSAA